MKKKKMEKVLWKSRTKVEEEEGKNNYDEEKKLIE